MQDQRLRRVALALTTRFSVVAVLFAAGVSVWPGSAGSASTAPKTAVASVTTTTSPGVKLEAQQLSGSWVQVADAGATNGSAVVIKSGALYTTTSLPSGAYLMSARVRSAGERITMGANLQSVGTAAVTGGWRTVSFPVRISGSTGWGLMADGPIGANAQQPVYVDWVSLSPTTAGYTTIGNKILDPSGRPYIPRGVNRGGLELAPTAGWLSDNDFLAMSWWGSTIVRLQVSQSFWLSTDCSFDAGYAKRIDDAVQSITKRGMVALIDLHSSHAGSSCGKIVHPPMADDYSVQFWTQVANRYKANPLVAFDLLNEPYYVDANLWRNGGTPWGWHAVGMQQLYDTVRATGATNLVFVSGIGWAYHVEMAVRTPIDGYGIVYSTHVYSPQQNEQLPTTIDSAILPAAAKYPVVIGEFGTMMNLGTYNRSLIDYAESHGLGWIAFAWNEGPYPVNFALLQSFRTYQPSPAGQPVRDALWKAKGWTTFGGL